jgi:hypothetical protein
MVMDVRTNRFEVSVVSDYWAAAGIKRPLSALRRTTQITTVGISRSWQWSGSALLATLLVHFLAGSALLYGFGGVWVANAVPNRSLAMTPQGGQGGVMTTLLLLVDEPPTAQNSTNELPLIPEPENLILMPKPKPTLPELESEVSASEHPSQVASTATDDAIPKTPQGIYLTQIRARIERSLASMEVKRVSVGRCEVSIQQSSDGKVTAVEFLSCLSADSWKQALAQAIRYASPLPAPPDQSVFMDKVVMEF